MDTTRVSLLLRIKDPGDTQAWSEFHELYSPLLYRYARARGLGHEDAEDVRSTCYEAIVREIAKFNYDRQKGAFKAWLRTIVNRRAIDLLRRRRELNAGSKALEELPTGQTPADELWDQHWRRQHLRYCVKQAMGHVSQTTYEAFRLLVEEEKSVPDVCKRLDLTPNQVYKAKSKMLACVRELMATVFPDEGYE